MRFLKEFWQLIVFVLIIAVVDNCIARAVCQENSWPMNASWLLTAFAVATLFFWSGVTGFSTGDFFDAKVSWKKKLGAGATVLLGIAYTLAVWVPKMEGNVFGATLALVPIVVITLYVTKWCANFVNCTLGFFLAAIFDFRSWMATNRKGLAGFRRYS